MGYSISYANGPSVTLDTIRRFAVEAGLTAEVARLDDLAKHGTRYSYEDFDVLSSVAATLRRAGIDVTKEGH